MNTSVKTGYAVVYPECNFGGDAIILKKGHYEYLDLQLLGIDLGIIASMVLGPGTIMVLYRYDYFSGPGEVFVNSYKYPQKYTCLNVGYDNIIMSVEIFDTLELMNISKNST